MVVVFDVFKVDADERLYRLGTAKSLKDAKKFVEVFAVDPNRHFCAIDRTTGETVVLKTGQRLESM
jgi:hypothetical protein